MYELMGDFGCRILRNYALLLGEDTPMLLVSLLGVVVDREEGAAVKQPTVGW